MSKLTFTEAEVDAVCYALAHLERSRENLAVLRKPLVSRHLVSFQVKAKRFSVLECDLSIDQRLDTDNGQKAEVIKLAQGTK